MTAMMIVSAVALYLGGAVLTARRVTPHLYRRCRERSEAHYRSLSEKYPSLYHGDHHHTYRTVAVLPARRDTLVGVSWVAVLWPLVLPAAALFVVVSWTWWTLRPGLDYPHRLLVAGWRALVTRPVARAVAYAVGEALDKAEADR